MAGGREEDVRAHIESIAARSPRELTRLTARLRGRAWPGGTGDRTEPAALRWLRLWEASGPAPVPPVCECASGRCLLCN